MLRSVRTILFFLLLGVMLNLIVAWSLQMLELRSSRTAQTTPKLKVNPKQGGFAIEPFRSPLQNSAGWPMIGFSSDAVIVMPAIAGKKEPVASISLADGLVLREMPRPFGWLSQHAFPLRPVLPGFIINTLLFAVLCWYVISGRRQTRYWYRTRRHICPACGYNLRGGPHAACPECGAATHRPL